MASDRYNNEGPAAKEAKAGTQPTLFFALVPPRDTLPQRLIGLGCLACCPCWHTHTPTGADFDTVWSVR